MERTPVINIRFHLRIQGLLLILASVDLYFILTNYWIMITPANSVKLAFGVEYYNLLFSLIMIFARYICHSIDSMREHPWVNKATCLLYGEIVIELIRLILYLQFTTIMWKLYLFPLFVARPIYFILRNLRKAILDAYMSYRAIGYLNTTFRNATAADLAGLSDTVCIICREDMHVVEAANDASSVGPSPSPSGLKRLPCSHIFHTNCLLSWFQRQQTCPTCRMHVLRPEVRRENQVPSVADSAAAATAPPATSTSSPSAGIADGGQAAAQPSWMFPGLPASFSGFPQAPAIDPNAAPGQPALFPHMFPYPYLQPAYVGMPMVCPGNLFPPLTSSMPAPPTDRPEVYGVSDAQLRASTIARFTALRQVNVLLQAAVLQMNAYLSTVTDPSFLASASAEELVTLDKTATATTAGVAVASGDSVAKSGGQQTTAFDTRPTGTDGESNLSPGSLDSEPGQPDADKSSSNCDTRNASSPDSSQSSTSDEKDLVVVRNRWLNKLESQRKSGEEEKSVKAGS